MPAARAPPAAGAAPARESGRACSAISTFASVPCATASESAAPGVVGVDVHLQRARVADDEHRVAERLELAFERVGVEPLALDDEARAVPVTRESS